MDGTLCAPVYAFGDEDTTIGFTETDWITFCIRHGEDSYEKCRPLPRVAAYARKLKAEGAKLYVLTGAVTSIEVDAKKKFIRIHYPDLFENVIAVGTEDRKLAILRIMAKENGCSHEECTLVEDTYSTILRANAEGFHAIHVAEFLAEP